MPAMVIVVTPATMRRALENEAFDTFRGTMLDNAHRFNRTTYSRGLRLGYPLAERIVRRYGARRMFTHAVGALRNAAHDCRRAENAALGAMEHAGRAGDEHRVAVMLERARRATGVAQALTHAADALGRVSDRITRDVGGA